MVVPNYYHKFKCIASECKHSCCIGWEIDVDADKVSEYRKVSGEMGRRLRENIAWEEASPHFILGKDERCPFLNKTNLCDLILTLGEESLCEICREHPRFYNELPDRTEAGIGLCCEEAARLILGQKEPVTLIGAEVGEDKIIRFRDTLIALAQEREIPVWKRCSNILEFCEKTPQNPRNFEEVLRGLERLDPAWDSVLDLLEKPADVAGFDAFMADRSFEYEQFLAYLIYRHVASAFDVEDAKARAAFSVMACELLHDFGAAIRTETGAFSFEHQVELARMFSSEIEYSEENLNILIDLFY